MPCVSDDNRLPSRHTILLVTLGSLGDLHPFIALATVLRRRGHTPIIATSGVFRAAVEAEGIGFHEIHPDQDEAMRGLGLTLSDATQRLMTDNSFVFRMVLPYLRITYDQILPLVAQAQIVVAHPLAVSTRLAAEKCGVAHVDLALQPAMFLSAYDPPPAVKLMFHQPRSQLALLWNKIMLAGVRRLLDIVTRPVARLRRELSLPKGTTPFIVGSKGAAVIGFYSRLFGPVQPDYPANTSIVGFQFHDGLNQGLDEETEAFLQGGSPPLVFTLGSFAVHVGEDFFRASIAAARALGRRAILLVGADQYAGFGDPGEDILVRGYVAHSALFPRALAVIHHCGIGTCAQALRAGRPQLAVPFFGDQPDNAARLVRLGVARALSAQRYDAQSAQAALSILLEDHAYAARAAELAPAIAAEDGAAAAADVIETIANKRALELHNAFTNKARFQQTQTASDATSSQALT